MTEGQTSGGVDVTTTCLSSVRTSPNLPLDGAGCAGVRVSWSNSAAGSRCLAHQDGQGLVEYGLILVIGAVVCVVSLVFFGDQLSSFVQLITSAV